MLILQTVAFVNTENTKFSSNRHSRSILKVFSILLHKNSPHANFSTQTIIPHLQTKIELAAVYCLIQI